MSETKKFKTETKRLVDLMIKSSYTNKEIFSGVRIDMDYFNGSREQFLKYAKVDD